jgi:hypothetical protein
MPTKKSKQLAKKPSPTPVPVPPADPARLAEAARNLDLELDWFFTYGETAAARGTLSMLPSHLAGRVLGSDTEAATARLAIDLEHEVRTTLHRVSLHDNAVLRAMYSPRSWPSAVKREFRALAPIAVRLFCASRPWPFRTAHQGLETAAARALADALSAKLKPAALRREAERTFGHAMNAYAEGRAVV